MSHDSPTRRHSLSKTKENPADLIKKFLQNPESQTLQKKAIIYLTKVDISAISKEELVLTSSFWLYSLSVFLRNISKSSSYNYFMRLTICGDIYAQFMCALNSAKLSLKPFLDFLHHDNPLLYNVDNYPNDIYKVMHRNKTINGSQIYGYLTKKSATNINMKEVLVYSMLFASQRYSLTQILVSHSELIKFIDKYMPILTRNQNEYQIPSLDDITPEFLMSYIGKVHLPFNCLIYLLVRYTYCKLFEYQHSFMFHIPGLYDIVLSFVEEDPNFKIDDLLGLFVIFNSDPIGFPVHLAFTEVDHYKFLCCMALTNLYLPTDEETLFATLSFEYKPGPTVSFLLAYDLQQGKDDIMTKFFIKQNRPKNISYEWKDEIALIFQISKWDLSNIPMEDMISLAEKGDISAIKILRKRPDCVSLLKPEENYYHSLLKSFLEPMQLDTQIPFSQNGAIQVFILKIKSKSKEFVPKIKDLLIQLEQEVMKITREYIREDEVIESVYSGIPSQNDRIVRANIPKSGTSLFLDSNCPFQWIASIIDSSCRYLMHMEVKLDDSFIPIITDYANHFYMNLGSFKDAYIKLFNSVKPTIFQDRKITHLYNAFKINNLDKPDLVKLFSNTLLEPTNTEVLGEFLIYLYENKFNNSLSCILSLTTKAVIAFYHGLKSDKERIEFYRNVINDVVFANKAILVFSDIMVQERLGNELVDILAAKAQKNPQLIRLIMEFLQYDKQLAKKALIMLADFPPDVPYPYIQLLHNLCHHIKQYDFKDKVNYEPIDLEWSEDAVTGNFDVNMLQESIWDEPQTDECTYNLTTEETEQHLFSCVTCGIRGRKRVCFRCAHTCHKNHDVHYQGFAKGVCECSKLVHHCEKQENAQEVVLDDNIILKMFFNVAEVSPVPKESQFDNNNTDFIMQYSRFTLIPEFNLDNVPTANGIKNSLIKTKILPSVLTYIVASVPFQLVCTHQEYIIMASGNAIFLYSSDLILLNQFTVSHPVFILKSNGKKIAAMGSSVISIITINNGIFAIYATYQPKLSYPNAYLIGLHWFSDDQMIYMSSSTIYYVNKDKSTIMINPSDNRVLSDATIISFAPITRTKMVMVSFSNGKIANYNLTNDKEIKITIYLCRYNSPILSYSEELEILFVSESNQPLRCISLKDINNVPSDLQFKAFAVTFPSSAIFLFSHPANHNILYFVIPFSFTVYSIEVNFDTIECSIFGSHDRDRGLPFFEYVMPFLSAFVHKQSVYLIRSNGQIVRISQQENKNQLIVPPSFWAKTIINHESVSLTANQKPINLKSSIAVTGIEKADISIQSNNPNFSIVGFRIYPKNDPLNIIYKTRRYESKSLADCMIPLTPEEVKAGGTFHFSISSNGKQGFDIAKIVVHSMKTDEIVYPFREKITSKVDWMLDSTKLFDYQDPKNHPTSSKMSILNILAHAFTHSQISSDDLKKLIYLLYQNREISSYARMLLIKTQISNDFKVRVWGEKLKDLIERGQIVEDMWDVVWHDYNMMPLEIRDNIRAVLWEKSPSFPGLAYAFM